MREFLCSLVFFGDGGGCAEVGGRFSSVYEGGVVSGRCDVLWVAEAEASEYAVGLDEVEGTSCVQWGGGVAGTDVRHGVRIHPGNVRGIN